MVGILFTLFVTVVAAFAMHSYYIRPALDSKSKKDNNAVYIITAAAIAFLLRIILGGVYKGHDTDMSCFIGWANAAFENGLHKFYTLDMFHDYPPGYMFVLYILGAIQSVFKFSEGVLYAFIKLPAIICDILTGIFVYKIAKKKFSDGLSTMLASLYLFNPAVILNSSLWGQVDSVYTLLILLMVYMITEKKLIQSYFIFAVCIFVKPQAFIFTPVLICGIIEQVFLEDFSREKFLKNLGFGLAAIAMMVVLALPFGIGNVFGQYKTTLASYPYMTVNAFNVWAAFGNNWKELNTLTNVLGYVALAAITVYTIYLCLKSKSKSKYYYAGAFLAFFTYMLSTKMHERYAFPVMIFLLMAFVLSTNPKNYLLYILATLSQFYNAAWVLFVYSQDSGKYFRSMPVNIASFINIALMVYFIYHSYKEYICNNVDIEPVSVNTKSNKRNSNTVTANKKTPVLKQQAPLRKFSLSDVFPKVTRIDVIAMAAITLIYSGIALYDLGDMHAPETEYMVSDESVTIDLGQEYRMSEYKFYLGSYELNEQRKLSVEFQDSNHNRTAFEDITSGSVFRWSEKKKDTSVRYVTLSTNGKELSVKEFAILDSHGNLITPVSASPSNGNALFDEQQEVPERQTFRNSTYFDEIYHARTGYEFVHSMNVYEWTHPPLGKVFIAAGIKLFGMNPFGWRIAGTLFGIIMIPIIYLFALKMFKKSWIAIVACLLLTFDFMHFAQTRIATIDVYVTFFIMLMYMFMYKYYSTSFYDTPLKKGLTYLALCGISMGLGIASKWTGVYAGIGLAVLFFITLYKRYDEYRYAVKNPKGSTDGISHKFIIENFKPYTIKTIVWCCIFFIAVPLVIYGLSYIPYLQAPDSQGIKTIIDNQNSMLTYHGKTVLGSEHPFSSKWYEWIIMKRPIWYYSGSVAEGVKEGISSFGNPLVWWLGVPAFFYMAYLAFRKKDKNALFLVIGYLAQLVSWIPITRLTFIYHYFPCVPFMVLMIGYSILTIYNEAKNKKAVMYGAFGYAALVIVLFAMFYPVLSGQPCSTEYAENFLKWFDSWVLL